MATWFSYQSGLILVYRTAKGSSTVREQAKWKNHLGDGNIIGYLYSKCIFFVFLYNCCTICHDWYWIYKEITLIEH